MTDNQLREIMDKLTKCVSGIQQLKEGQVKIEKRLVKLEEGQEDIKAGQARLEKEGRVMSRAMKILADESIKVRARVDILEDRIELSN